MENWWSCNLCIASVLTVWISWKFKLGLILFNLAHPTNFEKVMITTGFHKRCRLVILVFYHVILLTIFKVVYLPLCYALDCDQKVVPSVDVDADLEETFIRLNYLKA